MRSNPFIFLLIFAVIIFIIDFYVIYGIKKVTNDLPKKVQLVIKILFWGVTVVSLSGITVVMLFRDSIPTASSTAYFHFAAGTFMLFYVPKLIFILFNLLDDLIFGLRLLYHKIKHRPKLELQGTSITRRKFLNTTGLIFAAIPFVSLFYGIVEGRFNFTVNKLKLTFDRLPKKFSGIKILQISDFHLGSFLNNIDEVKEAVRIINEQDADIVLFTGDLVNNVVDEAEPFRELLASIKAKRGKYSILGNHDYGDYKRWSSPEDKRKNLQKLISLQREAGFDILLDENRVIKVEDEEIELLGVENWGIPPFPQYGNLEKALVGTRKDTFKILMSHDPTHWDAQIRATDIDFTLSGHTHGAQFGIEIPGWKWSPASMRYRQWGGLYQEDKQQIYVNTGIGFIGFPGRVGMPPEITVFELNSSKGDIS